MEVGGALRLRLEGDHWSYTLALWQLDHLDEEPFKGVEKVDQKPLDGGSRWLIEYEVTRRKRHRIPDVLDGKSDVVKDGLAS